MRIVSLVPSITDLLYALEASDQVVGITRYCIPPEEISHLPARIGGTKNLDIPLILSLKPDLIIANKEENDKDQVQQLEKTCRVWTTNIILVEDALDMILELGKKINLYSRAEAMVTQIQNSFKSIIPINKTCIYLIWNNPIMIAGGDTYIHAMLKQAGLFNLAFNQNRYPTITETTIKELNPEFILLSSEPYAFRQHHVDHFKNMFPDSKTILVDGQMFSWYGSKMLAFSTYLKSLVLS